MSRKLHVHLYTLTHQPLYLGAPNAEAIPEAEAGAEADADADPQSQVSRSIKSWLRQFLRLGLGQKRMLMLILNPR